MSTISPTLRKNPKPRREDVGSLDWRTFQPNYGLQVLLTSLPLLMADLAACGLPALLCLWQFGDAVAYPSLLAAVFSVFALGLLGLYPATQKTASEETCLGFFGTLLPWSLTACLFLPTPNGWWLLAAGVLAAFLCPILRSGVRRFASHFSWWGQRVVLLSTDRAEAALETWHKVNRGLRTRGVIPVGIAHAQFGVSDALSVYPFIGPLAETDQIIEETAAFGLWGSLVNRQPLSWRSQFPESPHAAITWLPESQLDRAAMLLEQGLRFNWRLDGRWSQLKKRSFDLAILLLISPFLLPVALVLATIVRLTSSGPIFYCGERVGRHGKIFRQWKFRTMVENAEEILERYLAENEGLRQEWEADHKLRDDPRVTRVGKVLRKLSLDELPQAWNVYCGEMSLVGPRPISKREIGKYEEDFEVYQLVTPGITGLWQVSGRNDTTYPERVAFDVHYVRHWSLRYDFLLMVRTVLAVVQKTGAY